MLRFELFVVVQWRALMLPDRYIQHGSQKDQIEAAGLTSKHIASTALSLIGRQRDSLHFVNLKSP